MEENTEGLTWDKPNYYQNGQLFIPRIFDSNRLYENIPEGFNSFKVSLKGGMKDEIKWDTNELIAHLVQYHDHAILWEIDMGLFAKLPLPISNELQYLSLGLALDQFRDTIWHEFRDRTLGLGLYRGGVDFKRGFLWDNEQISLFQTWLKDRFETEEIFSKETGIAISTFSKIDPMSLVKENHGSRLITLYCRDVAVNFLNLLVSRLPDALQSWLLIDAAYIQDPSLLAQVLNKERFENFQVVVANGSLPISEIAWDHGESYKGYVAREQLNIIAPKEIKVGICLPSADMVRPSQTEGLREILDFLNAKKIPYRIIPESLLITDWDQLDSLIVISAGLSSQGKRKLQGFCAAGGTIVTFGTMNGLPLEISFLDWSTNLSV